MTDLGWAAVAFVGVIVFVISLVLVGACRVSGRWSDEERDA